MTQKNFAIELFRLISEEEKSVVISPLSLSCSLAMAMIGAKNETANQIRDCIAKGSDFQEIHENYCNILSLLKNNKELIIANKAFLSSTLSLLPSYKSEMEKYYDGKFKLVDFENDKVIAAKKINDFVAETTNHKIEGISSPEMFDSNTASVIINAIYFDKKWLFPFTLLSSQFLKIGSMKFHSKLNEEHEIPFLTNDNEFRYVHTNEYQMVELPYQDEKFSMIVILPIEKFRLQKVLQNFDVSSAFQLLSEANKIEGNVAIPKFKTESTFNQLSGIFEKMGIVDAFDENKADFSNLSEQPVFVSSIIHKTYIDVDEEGTKAAAVTELQLDYLCDDGSETFYFLADHPFMYFIVDQEKCIYFVGTFYN